MSGAITGQARPAPPPVPIEGTPACPFCKDNKYIKADTLQMTTVRAVFECVTCGLFRLARLEEMDIWAKMKGRVAPTPPISSAITMDPEVVAKSTNIVSQ